MRKLALAVLVALIAASPAAAQDKKKKAKRASAAPAAASTQSNNQNSLNFAKDSLPVFLPSWSMPAYMAIKGDEQRKK
jgi:hypothetical protein